MNPTVKLIVSVLTPEQKAFCKSCSSLIALYRRLEYTTAEERSKGKLAGYLISLSHMGIISEAEWSILFNYYNNADRSKEEM